MKYLLLVYLSAFLLFGCADTSSDSQKSSNRSITSFSFKAGDNKELSSDVNGSIDETAKTVDLTVPYGTTVTGLVPLISNSGSSISPATGIATDFSNSVTYSVTAEDGTKQDYTVTVTVSAETAPQSTTPTSWTFVDGNGTDGINYDTTDDTNYPQLTVFNSKLYATWTEESLASGPLRIRVAEYDGSSTWNFENENGTGGINHDTSKKTYSPQLTVFNSKLYAIWEEDGDIRVAEWDGISPWSFIDGDASSDGINKSNGLEAGYPHLTVFNSVLYAIWREENGVPSQVRVAKWDGGSSWSFVDGNAANTGINKEIGQAASYPQLTVFNSELFATWYEHDGTSDQIRVAKLIGESTWNFVDGDGISGINYDTTLTAFLPQLTVFDSKLYIIWSEHNGTSYQIRVAVWDGNSTWSFVDGNGTSGINKDSGKYADYPQLTVFNSKLYATWHESNDISYQIRVTEWDENSTWNFVDGNGVNGINKDTAQEASKSQLTVFNSKLYAIWKESNGTKDQIRVAVAESE